MDKTLILISAFKRINNENAGTHTFSLEVDFDTYVNLQSECDKAIKHVLNNMSKVISEASNSVTTFELIDTTVIFNGITPLNNDHFEKALMAGL